MVAAGHAGVCAARLIDLACRDREFRKSGIVPWWYPRRRIAVWIASSVFMAATITWNAFDGGFYQIGPAGRNLLPLKLHAVFAFWLLAGGAIWVATLQAWERRVRGALGPLTLLVPGALGLATSVTTMSRAAYVVWVAPYVLITALRRERGTSHARATAPGGWRCPDWRALAEPCHCDNIPCLHLSHQGAGDCYRRDQARSHDIQTVPGARAPARTLKVQAQQIPLLFLQRWIGLEGVLVFASVPEPGWQLFTSLIAEDPALRMDGSYQRLAGSRYRRDAGFVFMTLPGVIGLAASSRMPSFVAFCLLAVSGAIWMVEYVGAKVTGSALVGAVAATSLAIYAAEMYSAYLTAIWFAEYICLLLAVGAITRATLPRRALEWLRQRTGSSPL